MNILTDALPESVVIGGKEYEINTDFRAGIAFELMIQKNKGDAHEILSLYFRSGYPDNLEEAIRAIELFYCCGKLPEKKEKPTEEKQSYCFEVDANAIFADFRKYYGIDLTKEYLHWWVFRALLFDLPGKSAFKDRIYYRTCELKDLSKKERTRILRIRKEIEIKNTDKNSMTLEERNKKMLDYVAKRRKETAGGEG